MNRIILTISGVFGLAFTLPSVSHTAELLSPYCKNAEDSADILACTKKYADEIRDDMQASYADIIGVIPEESAADLQRSQNLWVQYRDSHCQLEATLSATKSLERINELACQARLGVQRDQILTAMIDKQVERDESETEKPLLAVRWMNVLISDYPDIYWRFKNKRVGDINCDGIDENIVIGLKAGTAGQNKAAENFVLGISENPITGRPKSYAIDIPNLNAQEDETGSCASVPSLTISELPVPDTENKESEENNANVSTQRCHSLALQSGLCGNQLLVWENGTYSLQKYKTE